MISTTPVLDSTKWPLSALSNHWLREQRMFLCRFHVLSLHVTLTSENRPVCRSCRSDDKNRFSMACCARWPLSVSWFENHGPAVCGCSVWRGRHCSTVAMPTWLWRTVDGMRDRDASVRPRPAGLLTDRIRIGSTFGRGRGTATGNTTRRERNRCWRRRSFLFTK